jgi:hypothetical protein
MIGREFLKRLRLLNGRSETIKTRYELDKAGRLVEHVTVETHDPGTGTARSPADPPQAHRGSRRRPQSA